jgi:hypothetical protein
MVVPCLPCLHNEANRLVHYLPKPGDGDTELIINLHVCIWAGDNVNMCQYDRAAACAPSHGQTQFPGRILAILRRRNAASWAIS